jgi:hypothetical protein
MTLRMEASSFRFSPTITEGQAQSARHVMPGAVMFNWSQRALRTRLMTQTMRVLLLHIGAQPFY